MEGDDSQDQTGKHQQESLQDCSKYLDYEQGEDENVSNYHELSNELCCAVLNSENMDEAHC